MGVHKDQTRVLVWVMATLHVTMKENNHETELKWKLGDP